ncbi:MAG: DUF3301 domain-containing protein [Halothiobacillaceae bacterium]|jgi:hypothetical protein|nr:DUF3301 domain-containing protein [Halothiobacillaceae bacterium]
MLTTKTLFILLFMALLAVFWWRQAQARERAVRLAEVSCERAGLQLLDQSVGLKRLRPVRQGGRLVLERVYGFEFSRNGADRWQGALILRGAVLSSVELDLVQPLQPRSPV